MLFLPSFPHFFYKIWLFSDPIPEEEGSTKSLPKRGHQFIIVKPSPSKSARKPHTSNLQTASLLSHNTSSDSENSDLEKGKLMKPKQQKKNFSLGDSDDDDEGGIQMKKTWELFIWKHVERRLTYFGSFLVRYYFYFMFKPF